MGASSAFSSNWQPSQIELNRQLQRASRDSKNKWIAALSSLFVFLIIAAVVVLAPGFKTLRNTFFDWAYGVEVLPKVILGFTTNIFLTIIASTLVGFIALSIALIRTSRSPALAPIRFLATAYVDVFRSIPLILVILLVGFGLPALQLKGITSNVLILGTIAVVITYSAYVAEVIRSGILSVHPSQKAAARTLGLNNWQTMRHVVLPQALRRVTPPLLNDLVALIKDTGLVSILGVTDAVRAAQIETSRTFNYTPYITAAVLFLCITIPLTRFTDRTLRKSMSAQNAEGAA
ncbi:MAG: amino acid ABC transporter permease [Candidatus Nanopelagicaceae bacterium]|jgi:polar amino acid transport system permease protein